MRWTVPLLTALLSAAALPALDLPPSPADVPGVRIWPPPLFTHWPAIAYADESRNAAVALPVKAKGLKAEWGWEGDKPIPLTLPDDAERTSGLVDLRLEAGERRLRVGMPDGDHRLPLRVVAAGTPAWPLDHLVDGYPVDRSGVPVVLLATRPQPGRERTWALLQESRPRPTGRAMLVGDPLEALGDSPWTGLDAEQRPATDQVKAHHACLVALARFAPPLPRTLVWSPGNAAIQVGDIDPEEVRFLGVVRERFASLDVQPLLLLALPPAPVEERLRAAHDARREALVAEADRTGWRILDLARAAGPADQANRVGDNVYTAYPNGAALVREREALSAALAR